jgi:hypothetical protein
MWYNGSTTIHSHRRGKMNYQTLSTDQKLKCFELAIRLVSGINRSLFKAHTAYEQDIKELKAIAKTIAEQIPG